MRVAERMGILTIAIDSLLLSDMKKEELNYILRLAETYYAVNANNVNISNPQEHLIELLKRAYNDKRWLNFKNCMKNKIDGGKITITDKTTYAISTTCFKLVISINIENKIKYLIVFYISIISTYYAYKIRKIYTKESNLREMLHREKDQILLDKIRMLYNNENSKMDLTDKGNELRQLLYEKKEYREILEKEAIFYENNFIHFNEFPKEVEDYIGLILDCQKRFFGYRLFDKNYADTIVDGVETNLKINDRATLFDCLFTDFDDLS